MEQPVKIAPKPSIDVETKHPSRPTEPDAHGQPVPLSTYVKGLTLLPVRSPGHERVEMAVDRDGRLHLLCRDQAFRELRIVENWARSHRELIAMACPQHAIEPGRKTACHVFTADPVTVADLHASDLLLHVLAPVQVNGHTGWYSAALNVATH
jgi:hypothetical protein